MSLEPEQRAEINVALQPMVTGNSSWLVSLVDPASPPATRLLRRLLVTAAVPNPNVARTYEAALVRGPSPVPLFHTLPIDDDTAQCLSPCALLSSPSLLAFLNTVLCEREEDADPLHKSVSRCKNLPA